MNDKQTPRATLSSQAYDALPEADKIAVDHFVYAQLLRTAKPAMDDPTTAKLAEIQSYISILSAEMGASVTTVPEATLGTEKVIERTRVLIASSPTALAETRAFHQRLKELAPGAMLDATANLEKIIALDGDQYSREALEHDLQALTVPNVRDDGSKVRT